MNRVGAWVALVCFVSLALLGWWGLLNGIGWREVAAGAWFLLVGILAGWQPGEWQRKAESRRAERE